MSSLALMKGQSQRSFEFTREKIEAIKQTVAKGATDAEFEMFMHMAQHYGLDPFKKEIWFIKRVKKEKKFINNRETWDYPRLPDNSIDYSTAETVITTSRDGYLTIAQRDPNYEGLKGQVVYANDQFTITQTLNAEDVKHTYSHKDRGTIMGAWAVAFHKTRPPVMIYVPLVEYFSENSIWKKNTGAMILKVAESFVLKRQFGITGLVTAEELETDINKTDYVETAVIESSRTQISEPLNQNETSAGKTPEPTPKNQVTSLPPDEPKSKKPPEVSEDKTSDLNNASGESVPYHDIIKIVSKPNDKGKLLNVSGNDDDGEVVLLCDSGSILKDSFLALKPEDHIRVTGQLRENGNRFVMVEGLELSEF